ncbi:MAG TPA: (2Fe-2S)-binding protein [Candidatus Limnocylindrales bacterium]|nr:(2Fe-2S)-binding protein [Candidatus Limnocylindrales bacterium]
MTAARHSLRLKVNGSTREVAVPAGSTLLEVLREELQLTGTKYNCEQGECGACTVLLDGSPVDSCLVLAVSVPDSEVTTIEGLGRAGEVDPVQQAFIDADAAQCGYCTPGMVMAARSLLMSRPNPSEAEIVSSLEGNYCRCTGYDAIVKAIQRAAAPEAHG